MAQIDFEKIIASHQNEIDLIDFDTISNKEVNLTNKTFKDLFVLGKSKNRKNRKVYETRRN